jgi:hypothetical protein
MTDPAFVGTLVRSICSLSHADYDEVLRRLEDPSHARLSPGLTWSIFKALDAMDREERRTIHALILEQRARSAPEILPA